MDTVPRKIFVLGAGFTRAFFPNAPLLTDDYYSSRLAEVVKEFKEASLILNLEVNRNSFGRINLERLMTRLEGGMPYDSEWGAEPELRLLLSRLKECVVRRFLEATDGTVYGTDLAAFARYCVDNEITCITFNYDDFFDRALWEVAKVQEMASHPYWHPDGGYGFFCKRSETCIRDVLQFMDRTAMLFLKLHGSLNWRIKRGYSPPYSVDAIVHDESWCPSVTDSITDGDQFNVDRKNIWLHLQPEPFIVPPVLIKSSLVREPILRLIWSLAHMELEKAEEVIFIGYSLPRTDMAADFLFSEGLEHLQHCRMKVVNFAQTEAEKAAIRSAYKDLFPQIPDENFDFRGALDWLRLSGGVLA